LDGLSQADLLVLYKPLLGVENMAVGSSIIQIAVKVIRVL
jgi:hypothetical protein